jgi:hypothetical protein
MAESQPVQCKGAAGQACPKKVTFEWTPVLSAVETESTERKANSKRETVYLTCELGHTNPYIVDDKGEIVG